jgi:hypothetical protein
LKHTHIYITFLKQGEDISFENREKEMSMSVHWFMYNIYVLLKKSDIFWDETNEEMVQYPANINFLTNTFLDIWIKLDSVGNKWFSTTHIKLILSQLPLLLNKIDKYYWIYN